MAVNAQAYFSANPDVAASYAENAYGMTPQQFADFHYENYGRNEQRSPTGSVSSQQILDFLTSNPNLTDAQIVAAMNTYGVSPTQMAQAVGLPLSQVQQRYDAVTTSPVTTATTTSPTAIVSTTPTNGLLTGSPVTSTTTSTVETPISPTVESQPTQQTVTDYQGNTYNTATILNLAKQITPSIDPNAVKGGVFSTSGQSVGFNYDEASRILGKAPTASEQVILDMARHLAKEGITDLNQVNATETNRRFGSTFTGGGGTIYEIKKNADGSPVISTWSKDTSDKKTILTGLALAALAFGIPGLTEGVLSSAPAGATLGTIGAEAAVTGTAAGTTGLTLAELGGTAGAGALTAAETAALYGTGASTLGTAGVIGSDLAGLSGIPAGTGALTAAESAALYGTSGLTTGALTAGGVGATGLMGTGTGLTTAGAGGLGGASGAAGLGSSLGSGLTAAGAGGLGGVTGAAGLGGSLGSGLGALTAGGLAAGNSLLGGAALGSTLASLGTGVGGSLLGSTVGSTLGSTVGSTLGSTLANTAASTLGRSLTSGNIANLLSGGLGTAGSLLQMQQSKEAAQAAQQRIDAETAAAKASSAFRPIGMTTRFGTSQFAVDPVTGQLTSAGYTLSPEAKNAQDRLVKLAESGLQQAEGAQAQFAPLQTGAQNLFNLGNQYIAQSPEAVAQNYLNQQMALLQPGRELELANLQNRLQQQGRGGLSVAQGGTMGATTPELQALYNARAQQEAQLAANAQQYGQQNVAFGAGLLGTGAQTMGQYYGGQQAAYSPYTTALGQVQNLESMAQQPLQMGATLGQQASAAGARMGELGLRGAGQSVALATGSDATRSLGAQSLIAAGNPNAQFGQAIGSALGGLFNAPQSGFSYGQYGTGIDPSTGEYFGSLYF